MVTPNRTEFEAVVGVCRNDAELIERGYRLRDALALDALPPMCWSRGGITVPRRSPVVTG